MLRSSSVTLFAVYCRTLYFFSSLNNPGSTLYEIDDTVALLRNVLFRDHLDRLLCDYTSHEGSSVWDIGGWGTDAATPLVRFSIRKYVGLQFPDDIREGDFHLL